MGNPYHDPRNGQFTTGPGGAGPRTGHAQRGKGLGSLFGVKDTGKVYKAKRTTAMSDKEWEAEQERDGKPIYDFTERADYVDEKLTTWRKKGIDTQFLYRTKNGEWTPSRQKQQKAIMDEIWETRAANVPNQGRAIMAGGLGGAGKGYTLDKKLKVDQSKYFTVNPDDVKELMAKRGMIPALDKRLTPMELSPLAHEEASQIATRLAYKAYSEKKNLVWDITMSSEGSVTNKRLGPMRDVGYTDIQAVFVDVSVDKSIRQARSRWENGLTYYADGSGDGGRFLPSAATEENKPTQGSKYRSKNREVFEAVKSKFDGYQVYDNEVGSTLVDSKGNGKIGK